MTLRQLGVGVMAGVWAMLALPGDLLAHAMAPGDKGYIMCSDGVMIAPFLYLGAKHMVTGVDHLLFLFGVIFFLYRLKEIGLYVTLFAVGHSLTLILGVLGDVHVNPFAIDAIIGFSVVYKGLDNLGVLARWFGREPNIKVATLVFGLFHGAGLATKLIDLQVSANGLFANLIAFNVGVEVGQLMALSALLVGLSWWRRSSSFDRHAARANVGLVIAGLLLIGFQLASFFTAGPA